MTRRLTPSQLQTVLLALHSHFNVRHPAPADPLAPQSFDRANQWLALKTRVELALGEGFDLEQLEALYTALVKYGHAEYATIIRRCLNAF